MKKIFSVILSFVICFILCVNNSYAYSLLYNDEPIVDKSQAEQFLKDRNTSKKMLKCLDFIYEYSEEVGIDPSIVVAMSSIETGYGKSNLFVNHNNPGGIKSSRTSNGWAHYDSAEDGYRGMINLLATYAGLRNPSSYLHGVSTTTQGLAGIYWTNYGNDAGYHGQLSRQIETMRSYPVKKEKEKKIESELKIKDTNKTTKTKTKVTSKPKNDSNGLSIIYNILNKDNFSSGYDYIMNFLK